MTLTTRVRIEILRALGSVLTTDSQQAFVKGFSSRPVLCVKTKDLEELPGEGQPPSDPGRNYTFCEAIEKWGRRLSQSGLVKAYRKARPAFIGCLEQYFVVLRERQVEDVDEDDGIFGILSGANTVTVGSSQYRGSTRFQQRSSRGPRWRGFGNRGAAHGSKRPLLEDETHGTPSKIRNKTLN